MSLTRVLSSGQYLERICVFFLPIVIIFSRALGDIILVLIGLAFLYLSYKNNEWSWLNRSWLKVSIFLWGYCIIIVSLFAYEPLNSFLYSLIFMIGPLFCAALSYWLLKDQGQLKVFEFSILLIVIFIMLDSVYQFYTGSDLFGHVSVDTHRLTGPFDKLVPGTFTLRIVFIALCGLYFSNSFKSDQLKVFLILGSLIFSIAFIFLTGERMALLCMVSGSIILTFFLFKYHNINRKRFISFVLISISSLFVFISFHPKMIQRSIHSSLHQTLSWENTAYGHTTLVALLIWKNSNPWTGIGIKNYTIVCNNQSTAEVLKDYSKRECAHPHNFYVEWLVSGGPIALLSFILILYFILGEILQKDYKDKDKMLKVLILLTVFVSFWPFMCTMSIFSNWISSILWMTLGWSLASSHNFKSSTS